MSWKPERVLAIAPHSDDYELGAGGTLARLVDAGVQIDCIVCSTVKERFDNLEQECSEAAKILGLGGLYFLDMPVDMFPAHRQEILQFMVDMRELLHPDTVLVPSSSDIHQDHGVVHQEAIRAFKTCTILGWEQPWNNLNFNRQLLVGLEEQHFRRKLKALAKYRTQKDRPYMQTDYLRAWGASQGTLVGKSYAEAFEVIRWVL